MAEFPLSALKQNVTTVVQIEPRRIETFTWTVKVPPKTRMATNFKSEYGVVLGPVRFSAGCMTIVNHSLEIKIDAALNKLALCWCLDPKVDPIKNIKTFTRRIQVQLLQDGELLRSDKCKLQEPKFNDVRKLDEFAAELTLTDWIDTVDSLRIVVELDVEKGAVIRHQPITDRNEDEEISQLKRMISRGMRGLANFSDYLYSDKLADVTICCDGEEIKAHKIVLSNRSLVFTKMFESDTKEREIGRVDVEDVDFNTLQQFMQWCYTCDFQATDLQAQLELLKIADRYCVDTLKNICIQRILDHVTVDNALEMFSIGDTYRIAVLKKRAIRFIKSDKARIFGDDDTIKCYMQKYPKLLSKVFFMD